MTAKGKYYSRDAYGTTVGLGDLVASSFSYGDRRIPVKGIITKVTNAGFMELDVEINPVKKSNPSVGSTKKYHPEHTILIVHEDQIDKHRSSLVEWNKNINLEESKK